MSGKKLAGSTDERVIALPRRRRKKVDLRKASLCRLCQFVIDLSYPFDDLAEYIEDRAYEECDHGSFEQAVAELQRVATFFEHMENKNEENCRDLAEIYVLVGQMNQYAERFSDSINWFSKSVVVDDQYPVAYHNLAISYMKLSNIDGAIRALDQEILLAPGNYYSYLLLAELYERQSRAEEVEACLKMLLERDSKNIQALHRLIRHYEKTNATIDTALLCRRLLGIKGPLNRMESVIRTHYLCREKRFAEALDFVEAWHKSAPEVTVLHLVRAHVLGELRQYTQKRFELATFKERNHGREDVMRAKLDEFKSIFGEHAAHRLGRRLVVSALQKHELPVAHNVELLIR